MLYVGYNTEETPFYLYMYMYINHLDIYLENSKEKILIF